MNKKNNSVDDWIIPLYKIYSDDEDVEIITKVVKRGTNWAIGPEIEEFENKIKNYVGCEYCAALNSGTSALHATLLAYGIKKGDEVIVPSFSFISTANSVLHASGTPIFADIEENNYGLDPESILQKISPSTKAIMPMDYGGLSCKIFEIKEIAQKNKLNLIEDAAEGLGASVNGKKVGSVSDASIFSFCGNKVLTTGEGGAVVTNSRHIYEKIKLLRSHGSVDTLSYFNDPSISQYLELGYNWRMSSMTAALGISQIDKLDKLIKMRQDNAKQLSQKISKHKDLQITSPPSGYDHIYQMFSIRLSSKKIRDDLQNYLLKKRIFCKIYFSPIHLTAFYRENFGTNTGLLPKTENISEQILTLPIYPNMTSEEKEYMINSIDEFFESSIVIS